MIVCKIFKSNFVASMIITSIAVSSCQQSGDFSGRGQQQPARKQTTDNANPKTNPSPTPSPDPTPTPSPAPLPPNAVVQGSFTVWAVPPNPQEGQPYDVHIRVKLPSTISQYNKQDLSGVLRGTDGYKQALNDPYAFMFQQFYFTSGSGSAELVMNIPGALQGVDDSLAVHSTVLNESQSILVHFN